VRLLGYLMVTSPFIAVFALAWRESGLLSAIGVYTLCAVVYGLISGGLYLIGG
jgi:hypothetical protein